MALEYFRKAWAFVFSSLADLFLRIWVLSTLVRLIVTVWVSAREGCAGWR
jgi:hypothetical protein